MKTFKKLLVTSFILLTGSLFAKDKAAVALDGYCPVCYVAAGKAVKGTEEFKTTHEGKIYYFVKQGALDAFVAEPQKFLPAYDGYCAYGMSLGKKFESDPTVFTVIDGVIYLNKDASISKIFHKDTKGAIAKADAEWKKMTMTKEAEMKKEKEMAMKKEAMMKDK